jgi:uncharacterized membrane protein YgaE (UPF0421/DUF939 family)
MGFRVIKTALAAVTAIYISQWIGLASPISAGLLAILGVEVTKRKGISSALKRIAASVWISHLADRCICLCRVSTAAPLASQ